MLAINQLAHDGRLPDALHRLAHEPTADKQRNYLTQKYDFRGAGCGFVGRQQRRGEQAPHHQKREHGPEPTAAYRHAWLPQTDVPTKSGSHSCRIKNGRFDSIQLVDLRSPGVLRWFGGARFTLVRFLRFGFAWSA